MADFCFDYDPNGLGGDAPIGDFNYALAEFGPKLAPGFEVCVGICEGHGSTVHLSRHDDGSLWFEHGPGYDYVEQRELPPHPPKMVDRPHNWSTRWAWIRGFWCKLFHNRQSNDIVHGRLPAGETRRCTVCKHQWWE